MDKSVALEMILFSILTKFICENICVNESVDSIIEDLHQSIACDLAMAFMSEKDFLLAFGNEIFSPNDIFNF